MAFADFIKEVGDNRVFNETLEVLNEKNIIKMDKKTLRKKLLTQATLLSAKEADDILYKRYVKASKIRRETRSAIQVKYEAKGKRKLKEFIQTQKMAKKALEKK